ncbi:MAG: hypothetical protein KGQ59_05470 [Bdellovibrionales bacterium]|nr:hypothetical protein [Bdellovibrionales bacterium]
MIDSGTSYSMVSAGGSHTCGVTTLNTLRCWEDNNFGQLSNSSTGLY